MKKEELKSAEEILNKGFLAPFYDGKVKDRLLTNMKEYAAQAVKYALEQAAENAKADAIRAGRKYILWK